MVVVAARDGREALSLARSQRIDIVLSDVMMPHLKGTELWAHMVQTFPALRERFILMSSFPLQEDFAGRQTVKFLQKPFTLDALWTEASACLGRIPAPDDRV